MTTKGDKLKMKIWQKLNIKWRYFKFKSGSFILESLCRISILVLFSSILIPCWIIGNQGWNYLKTGVWIPNSCLEFVKLFNLKWVEYPDSWKGLHVILEYIPSSIPIFIILFYFSSYWIEVLKQRAIEHDNKYKELWDTKTSY